jgi:single-strand DNA-binding protein
MNKIILAGRLTRDPELRTTDSGTEVCNFSIAVDRRFKDKNGEKQADFISCTAWQKTGVFVNTYFHKGDGITIDGRLESRKYIDKDGNNRTAWDVICDNVEFPLSKPSGGGANQGESLDRGFTEVDDIDDSDLPF